MVLSGGGNAWTDHVRAFATKNKMTYMCALSNPECSSSYKANKPVKKRGRPPKKAAQQEEAEFDYGDVFEGTPMTEQSLTPPERSSLAKASKAKARKTADRVGMMAEDVNVGSDKGSKQVAKVVKAKKAKVAKPSGRPRKYADAEEARKANIQKTNENRKKYVSQRKVPIKPKKLTKAEKIAEETLQRLMSNKGITREQAIEDMRKRDEALEKEKADYLDYLSQPVGKKTFLASVTVPKGRGKGKKGGMTPPPPPKKTRCSPVRRRVSPVSPIPMPPHAFRPIEPAPPYMGEMPPILRPIPRRPIPRPPTPPEGGATAQQRGIAAQLRSFFDYQDKMKFGKNLKYFANMLSAIVHSAEYPTNRLGEENKYGVDFGSKSNIFRDYNNKYDDRAEQFIKRSLEFIRDNPSTFYPTDYYDSLIPKKLSVAAPVFKPSGGNISMTIDSDSDSDDDMSGINWREICDALK